VLARDLQLHPVSDSPVHVDFLRVDPETRVKVAVPVIFENQAASPGIKRGGVLNVVRHEIELRCLATQIPHEIRVDLTGLEIGDSVHISAIKLPEGVMPTIRRDFTVATVAAPSTMTAEAEAAAAAAPEAPAAVEVITAREGKAPEGGEAAPAAAGKGAEAKKPEAKPKGKKE
jgi:large subunit ribosomal protein L25